MLLSLLWLRFLWLLRVCYNVHLCWWNWCYWTTVLNSDSVPDMVGWRSINDLWMIGGAWLLAFSHERWGWGWWRAWPCWLKIWKSRISSSPIFQLAMQFSPGDYLIELEASPSQVRCWKPMVSLQLQNDPLQHCGIFHLKPIWRWTLTSRAKVSPDRLFLYIYTLQSDTLFVCHAAALVNKCERISTRPVNGYVTRYVFLRTWRGRSFKLKGTNVPELRTWPM